MNYLAPLSLLALIAVAGCDMTNMGGQPRDTESQIINDEPGSADDDSEMTPDT